MEYLWQLIAAILVPLGGGFAIAAIAGSPGEWYNSLNKPSWSPPSSVFPVAWIVLYVLMGTASWIVWRHGGFAAHPLALSLYVVQLLLNFAWSPILNRTRRIDLTLVDVGLLWLAIAASIATFWPISTTAAYLLIPYLIWVTLGGYIYYYIHTHNTTVLSGLTQPLTA